MKQRKQRSPGDVFRDHVILVLLIKRHSHIKNNIRMSQTMQNFYLRDKLSQSFLRRVFFPKSFDCNWRTMPFTLKHISIPSRTNHIDWCIKLKLSKLNDIFESWLKKGIHKFIRCSGSNIRTEMHINTGNLVDCFV